MDYKRNNTQKEYWKTMFAKSSRRTRTLIAALLAVGLHSCDILDQSPRNEVEEDIALQDLKGLQVAVTGLYNQIQDANYYGRNFLVMCDVSSNQGQSIGTWDFYREMDTYEVSTGNTENGAFYSRAYRAISVANSILRRLGELSDVSEADANYLRGHAHFVRGLAHFDLVRTYGGVPGVVGTLGVAVMSSSTPGELQYPSRAGLQETYDFVEQDLLAAEQFLESSNDRSMASKGAARALLSRLYLYTKQYDEAEKYATDVINEAGNYSLLDNYLEIFAGKLTSESILELTYNTTDPSNIRNWYYPTSGGGRGDLASHPDFVAWMSADPDDIRGTQFAYQQNLEVYYPTKYGKAGNIDNIHVIRIAEMYLNRAEARTASGSDLAGALADLNTIRARAGIEQLELTGQAELLEAIWEEQQREFAYEGHSLFDLVRTGRAMTVLQNMIRKNAPNSIGIDHINKALFPIPLFEMNANENMEQNEAYK